MLLTQVETRDQVAYRLHKLLLSFQPTSSGSTIGLELEEYIRGSLAQTTPLSFISAQRDMGLGQRLKSRSGLPHELDLILQRQDHLFIIEFKNYTRASSREK